jgi:hypothetical protein
MDRPEVSQSPAKSGKQGVWAVEPIPMTLTMLMQRPKHNRQYRLYIIAHQTAKVLIIPQVERTLSDLKVRTCDAFGELVEERDLDLVKFGRLHDFKDVFNFIDKHDFLGTVDFGPVFQESADDLSRQPRNTHRNKGGGCWYLLGKSRILFQELNNTIRQLRMIQNQTLGFVQRHQNPRQKDLVLLLERQGKPIDDTPQDLEEFGNPIKVFRLVHKLEKDIVDGPADKRAKAEEFPVYSVERGL